MNTCPDCRNDFVQPFVCTTCGAEKLYDETVRSQAAELAALRARVAEAERLVAELRKTEDIQSATIRDLHGEIETLCGHLGRIRDGGARTTSGKWLDWTRSTLREVAQDALDRKPVPVFRDAGNKGGSRDGND